MVPATMSSLLLSIVLQVVLSLPALAASEPEPSASLKVDPIEIGVNMFFSGETVHVEGTIPAGYEAAVLCSGEEGSVELKRKGKVLGFLWMSIGDVVFDNVPSFYVLNTSIPLADLAPAPVLEKLRLGYPALESTVVRLPKQAKFVGDFREFLKLKEGENLYSYDERGAKLAPGPGGAMQLSAECLLPTKAPWGEYEVRLFGFKAGMGELLRAERLHVAPVGVAARISALARDHGLLYGILAVVIALGVGLMTGFAFGLVSKKGD